MRSNDTPIFDALAREFETRRPLAQVAHALGGDALGDPLTRTHAADVSFTTSSGGRTLPRRARGDRSR